MATIRKMTYTAEEAPAGTPEEMVHIDGLPGGSAPGNATTSTPGLVKQATFVADPAADTPTKAEFVALRDALVTAGIMAAS